jgi:hypothetical protein
MPNVTVTLSLDDALVARVHEGDDLSAVVDGALRQYLDPGSKRLAADRRWAENNALAIEAMAGGAEETRYKSL